MFNHPAGTIGVALVALVLGIGCGSQPSAPTAPSSTTSAIRDDASFFRQFTQTDPLSRYTVLPNAEEFTTGRLDGSEAHRPIVRVSLKTGLRANYGDNEVINEVFKPNEEPDEPTSVLGFGSENQGSYAPTR